MEKENPKFASSNQEQGTHPVIRDRPDRGVVRNANAGTRSHRNRAYQNQNLTINQQAPHHAGYHVEFPTFPANGRELPQNFTNQPPPPHFVLSFLPLPQAFYPIPFPTFPVNGRELPQNFTNQLPQPPPFVVSSLPFLQDPHHSDILGNQAQAAPGILDNPRAHGDVSSQSLPGRNSRIGVAKTRERRSQNPQRFLEAQSAENIQLRDTIAQLQLELANCKGRLVEHELEISHLRQATEEAPSEVGTDNGITIEGQPAVRGRPNRAQDLVSLEPPSQPANVAESQQRRTTSEANPVDLDLSNADESIPATINQNNESMEIKEGTLTMPASLDN